MTKASSDQTTSEPCGKRHKRGHVTVYRCRRGHLSLWPNDAWSNDILVKRHAAVVSMSLAEGGTVFTEATTIMQITTNLFISAQQTIRFWSDTDRRQLKSLLIPKIIELKCIEIIHFSCNDIECVNASTIERELSCRTSNLKDFYGQLRFPKVY